MSGGTQRLMIGWCGLVAAFGVLLMGTGFAPTGAPAQALLELMGGAALTLDSPMRFAVGLMGAVSFGWGLTLLAVASVSDRLPAPVAATLWRRITAGIAVWYVVDSAISLATGFSLNAVSNTALAGAYLAIALPSGLLAARDQGALPAT